VDVTQSDSATELACINQSAALPGLVAIRWATWAPGSFLSFGAKNAVVRVYNDLNKSLLIRSGKYVRTIAEQYRCSTIIS
jgi:hypothetical protein